MPRFTHKIARFSLNYCKIHANMPILVLFSCNLGVFRAYLGDFRPIELGVTLY